MTSDQQRDLEELRAWLDHIARRPDAFILRPYRQNAQQDARRWLAAIDSLRDEAETHSKNI